jgi:hypothetical protein
LEARKKAREEKIDERNHDQVESGDSEAFQDVPRREGRAKSHALEGWLPSAIRRGQLDPSRRSDVKPLPGRRAEADGEGEQADRQHRRRLDSLFLR